MDIINSWRTAGAYEWSPQIPGIYQIECWGASGADRGSGIGGYGGYAKTYVRLLPSQKLYVKVGSNTTGFNGGGKAGWAGYGGGASDVRGDIDDIYHRFIVAGGGGTCGRVTWCGTSYAYGGGSIGGGGHPGCGASGGGGSQVGSGGPYPGIFGQGGNGVAAGGGYSGAGGGGWYGGGGASVDGSVDDDCGGGGGSGYVLDTTSLKPSGYQDNALYYCRESYTSSLIAGNATMPNPQIENNADGSKPPSTVVGNSGDGTVRITFIAPELLYFIEQDGYLYSTMPNFYSELNDSFQRIPINNMLAIFDSIQTNPTLFGLYNAGADSLFTEFKVYAADGISYKTIKPIKYFNLKTLKIKAVTIHENFYYNQLRMNYKVSSSTLLEKCQIQLKNNILVPEKIYDKHFQIISGNSINTMIKKYGSYYNKNLKVDTLDNIFANGIIGNTIEDYNIESDVINLSIGFTDNIYNANDKLKQIKLVAKTGNTYRKLKQNDVEIRYNQDSVYATFKESHAEIIINKLHKNKSRNDFVNTLSEF